MEKLLVSRRALFTSLLGAGAAATVLAQQQPPRIVKPGKPGQPATEAEPEYEVLSGSDIGFQVEDVDRDGTRVGRFVVRVDGKWVNVRSAMGAVKR